jgi:hypothetical protein
MISETCTPIAFGLVNEDLKPLENVSISKDDQARLLTTVFLKDVPRDLLLGYRLLTDDGLLLYFSLCTDAHPDMWPSLSAGKNTLLTSLPLHLLKQGKYKLELMAKIRGREWLVNPETTSASVEFEIGNFSGKSAYFDNTRKGMIAPILEWSAVK